MTAQDMSKESRSVDRKLRTVFAIAAVLLGVVLAGAILLTIDQVRGKGTGQSVSPADWPTYEDTAQGYSIRYPPDGRVDIVDGVASITNRDLACPECEPTPLRMFALSVTADPPQAGVTTGQPIDVGDERYPGFLTIDGASSRTARVDYQARGRTWQIRATFTEPVSENNPALDQFFQMVRSIHHR
jgi:hypothetical protein